MPVAVDASVALAWLLNEPNGTIADTAIKEGIVSGLAAPELFWIEVANVLGVHVRRRRLPPSERDAALNDLQSLQIVQHQSAEKLSDLVALSDRHSLTAYDAAYLELAVRLGAPLATLDGDLAAAARAEVLRVIGA